MKTVATRSESGLFVNSPEAPRSQRLVPHRPLVKTLGGAPPSAQTYQEPESFVQVEPRVLLGSIRERCAGRAAVKQVGLTMHASARSAFVRPHAFSMAICELVDNAVDASDLGQDVVVLASETGDRDMLWQIQDDGAGMSELVLEAIGNSAAGEALWSGIARARTVVEAHGGLIHFESTPTFGTTASVWLPRTSRAAPPAEHATLDGSDEDFVLDSVRPKPKSLRATKAQMLVVDDDPLLRQTYARILESYDVTLASNGSEALALALTRWFDAIVCDLMMPVMSGMQLFAALQQRAPGQATRICFVTGGGDGAEAFLASVPNPRLYKPFDGPSLLALVRQNLGR